jgi:lysozyme
MNRTELFDRLRPIMPNRTYSTEAVGVVNAIADDLGMERVGMPAGDGGSLAKAIATIKQFEGCELEAYPDPGTGGDPWTIGWGATGAGIRKGVRWTQQQADERLATDVMRFADGVDRLTGGKARPEQRAALISFAYNVGLKALEDSTLLKLHRAGDYTGAAAQFGRWVNAGGKKLNGLVKRRAAEAAIYRGEA